MPALASESAWQALLHPRPAPLPGALRIAIGQITLGNEQPWALAAGLPAAVGVQELVSSGLLRRADVQFVERRRFAEAAERERRGLARPAGAPPVGTSPGVELILTGSMSPVLGDSAYVELRLVEPATSGYRAAWRVGVSEGGDPAALARRVTGSLIAVLDSLGTLPEWTDPLPATAPRVWQASGVSLAAVDSFFRGVAAEDAYQWEAARRAYARARQFGRRRLLRARRGAGAGGAAARGGHARIELKDAP